MTLRADAVSAADDEISRNALRADRRFVNVG
jgi:hypothetical protein